MIDVKWAYVKIILAMCIVGSSVVVGKVMVESIPVFIASALRFIVAAVILIPLLLIKEGLPSLSAKDAFILFLQSLSGVFLFSVFMLYGLKLTTAMNAGVITSTLPAIVAILGFFILKEKVSKNTMLGVLLAISGIALLNILGVGESSEQGSIFLVGNLLIVAAVICEALFIILGKSILLRVSPLAISTLVSVFGVILFLPFAVYEAISKDYYWLTMIEWGLIIYFGVIVTVVAFILMYQGINIVPANVAGVLTSVIPISSVILAAIFINETLSSVHLIGMSLVFTAVYLTSKEEKNGIEEEL